MIEVAQTRSLFSLDGVTDGRHESCTSAKPFNLHRYQERALQTLEDCIIDNKLKVVIEMPTGAGKTRTALATIRRLTQDDEYAIFIVPSIDLAEQTYQSALEFFPPEMIGLLQGENNILGRWLTIASLDTLAIPSRRNALLRHMQNKRFITIVFDEAHGAICESLRLVLPTIEYKHSLVIGMTATPYRTDGQSLSKVFVDGLVYYVDIMDLIDQGYLLPFKALKVWTDLDLRGVKLEGLYERELGDTTRVPAGIIKRIHDSNRYAKALEVWETFIERDRTIIFANDIKDAQGFRDYFTDHGVNCFLVTGKTPREIRKEEVYPKFREGTLPVLISFGVLTTGVDFPRAKAAIIGRFSWMGKTPNIGLHQQAVGRVIRLSDERDDAGNPIKTCGKIVYLADREHSLVPPVMSTGYLPGELTAQSKVKARYSITTMGEEPTGLPEKKTPDQRLAIDIIPGQKMRSEEVDILAGEGWTAINNHTACPPAKIAYLRHQRKVYCNPPDGTGMKICHYQQINTILKQWGSAFLRDEKGRVIKQVGFIKGQVRTWTPTPKPQKKPIAV